MKNTFSTITKGKVQNNKILSEILQEREIWLCFVNTITNTSQKSIKLNISRTRNYGFHFKNKPEGEDFNLKPLGN